MDFYPDGLPPPDKLITSDFLLRPLRTTDVTLDYEAVMESAAMLRRWGGAGWPAEEFTVEGNLADLALHEQEHQIRVAFTYTMMNLAESECLGCVYVNQLAEMLRLANSNELFREVDDSRQAIVRFWVRQSRLGEDLDWHLLRALLGWFKDQWAFSYVFFRANDRDERQKSLLAKAGLFRRFTLDVPGRLGPFLLYGPIESPGREGIV